MHVLRVQRTGWGISCTTKDVRVFLCFRVHRTDICKFNNRTLQNFRITTYNVPLDIRDKHGATPLHVAVAAANVDAVRTLLHAGSPVNLHSGGKTPVQMCANNPALFGIFRMQAIQCIAEGKVNMFAQLVESGIPAARTADDDQSLLHWAATFAQPDMVGVLIDSGAKVNAVSAKGETALHLAVREGDRQCVQILLRAGADADLANRAGKSAREMDKDGILLTPTDVSQSKTHASGGADAETASAESAEETAGHAEDLTLETNAIDSDSDSGYVLAADAPALTIFNDEQKGCPPHPQ